MKLKIHESYRNIVALADNDLIGKTFEEGKLQIEVKESFFGGDEVDFDRAVEVLKDMKREDATFNLVGEESCKCAVEAGIVDGENLLKIDGVPVILILI